MMILYKVIFYLALTLLLMLIMQVYQNPDALTLIMVSCLATPITILVLLSGWLSYRPLKAEAEPIAADQWAEMIGDPQFDPEKGIFGYILVGTETVKVLMQPKWWPYLPSTVERNEQEALCDGSVVSHIAPGKEPSFLVVIQNEKGETKGMGSRVRIAGRDVLLTSHHVVKSSNKLFIAKYSNNEQHGKRFEIGNDWELDFCCSDPLVDMIGVIVPAKVWSALGVGVAKAIAPNHEKKAITVFGADNSSKIKCSQGIGCVKGGFLGSHSATTVKSWSGSPIVSKGCVIGVHKGSNPNGQGGNIFSVLHPVIVDGNNESSYDHGYFKELEEDEEAYRPDLFDETLIHGRGKIRYSDSEYVRVTRTSEKAFEDSMRAKGKLVWSEMVDDEYDDSYQFFDLDESLDDQSTKPLNEQRAEKQPFSPPLNKSEATSILPPRSSDVKGCPSLSLDSRVLTLENLLEASLVQNSVLQESISLISKTLTGLSAVVEQNSILSSTNLPGSNQRPSQRDLKKPSPNSSKNIPEQAYVPVSKETGTSKGSKRASRRLRKKSLKETPPQESPLAH